MDNQPATSSSICHKKPSLVSVTLFIPYLGVPHAGGEYVRRHYVALSDSFSITVVAPDSSENRSSMQSMLEDDPFKVHSLMRSVACLQPLIKIIKFFRGASLGVDLELSFRSIRSLKESLVSASFVEFQWTESASLSRLVRKIAPNTRQILVAHDVLCQRWDREAVSSRRLLRRLFFRGRAAFARRAERRYYDSVDTVIVFSEKDASLVRAISPHAAVYAVNPPLLEEGMSLPKAPLLSSRQSVLFTAAFNRPENNEAALWLLNKIWPKVINKVPSATLTLAGANPSPELMVLASRYKSVELTGYVDDLSSYYRDADIFVAPVLHGAGVKFKNITAMLWELPIVSTPIGAEGIGTSDHYLGVTDDAEAFANFVITGLIDRDHRATIAYAAKRWAGTRYSQASFRQSLGKIYSVEMQSRMVSAEPLGS